MTANLHDAIADHVARTLAAVRETEERACFIALLLTDEPYVGSLQLVYMAHDFGDFEIVDTSPRTNDVTLVSTPAVGAPACAWPWPPEPETQEEP